MTQAALSRRTGLSTATVSNLVANLRQDGIVATRPTTSSGRRAVLVELDGSRRSKVAVGIDIGRRHLRIILATPAREVAAEESVGLDIGHDAEHSIAEAVRVLSELLERSGHSHEDVIGCGVGIPGPIDGRTGEVSHGAILPTWVGFRPVDRLQEALGLPVFLDNDANLGALAEVTWGDHTNVPHLVYLKVASGIGAGLILSEQLYRGSVGITGEIGHVPVTEYGEMCRCGNRGCLETVASTAVMLDTLSRTGLLSRQDGVAQLVGLVLSGDPAAARVVEDAGLALGQALGVVTNLLNPDVVVIGGPLAPLEDHLLAPVRRGLLRFASPAAGAVTQVVMSSLGDRAEALGACSLVFRNVGSQPWSDVVATL